MSNLKKTVVGAWACLALLSAGYLLAQQPVPLNQPKARQSITHLRINQISWFREGIHASAQVGYLDAQGNFQRLDGVEKFFNKAAIDNALTQTEKDALVSIRQKVRAALVSDYGN